MRMRTMLAAGATTAMGTLFPWLAQAADKPAPVSSDEAAEIAIEAYV